MAGTLRRPPAAPYDVVFLDPPYPLPDAAVDDDLHALRRHGWLVPGAMVVVERSVRSAEPAWPAGIARRPRRSGTARPCFGTVTPSRRSTSPAGDPDPSQE